VQVLTLTGDATGTSALASQPSPPSLLIANPEARATYELFRATPTTLPAAPPHLEFLIDRQGYLRARWEPPEVRGWRDLSVLLSAVDTLNHEPPAPSATDDEHAH
jgi:putative copper resistance protein D